MVSTEVVLLTVVTLVEENCRRRKFMDESKNDDIKRKKDTKIAFLYRIHKYR